MVWGAYFLDTVFKKLRLMLVNAIWHIDKFVEKMSNMTITVHIVIHLLGVHLHSEAIYLRIIVIILQ